MLVRDLIELLAGYDADMEVHIAYGYGDHWRTQVAPKVTEVSEGAVVHSEYHRMPKVVEFDYDDEDGDEAEGNSVVILG